MEEEKHQQQQQQQQAFRRSWSFYESDGERLVVGGRGDSVDDDKGKEPRSMKPGRPPIAPSVTAPGQGAAEEGPLPPIGSARHWLAQPPPADPAAPLGKKPAAATAGQGVQVPAGPLLQRVPVRAGVGVSEARQEDPTGTGCRRGSIRTKGRSSRRCWLNRPCCCSTSWGSSPAFSTLPGILRVAPAPQEAPGEALRRWRCNVTCF